jgi:hypothetical protein
MNPMESHSNRRARSRRIPLNGSRDAALEQEVADALAATPAERIEAIIALLDSAYALWAVRGLDRDEGLCRFPGITQQRRRGLCRDRGMAVLAHIPYRTSRDLDVLIEPTLENARKARRAVGARGTAPGRGAGTGRVYPLRPNGTCAVPSGQAGRAEA